MERNVSKKYDLEERLINFSVNIIDIAEMLPNTTIGNHIAGQLIRCGTSPSSNYGEATSAESRKDFIHKIKIVLKELRETLVWLKIIHRKSLLVHKQNDLDALINENNELISIFVTSSKTPEKNMYAK